MSVRFKIRDLEKEIQKIKDPDTEKALKTIHKILEELDRTVQDHESKIQNP